MAHSSPKSRCQWLLFRIYEDLRSSINQKEKDNPIFLSIRFNQTLQWKGYISNEPISIWRYSTNNSSMKTQIKITTKYKYELINKYKNKTTDTHTHTCLSFIHYELKSQAINLLKIIWGFKKKFWIRHILRLVLWILNYETL